jgi:YHS domain-containing protein
VAYFAGQALPGDPAINSTWKGAQWRFVSAANKALFEKDPEAYAPQFGGHCSYAASKGFTAKCDPTAFKIEGKKLYLFNDLKMRANWQSELDQDVIGKAQRNWASRPQ